jgi:transcriptional regulator with XRE-family HTH domain
MNKPDWVRPGITVEVKRRVSGRAEPIFVPGTVKEVAGKGCFIRTFDGNSNHYNYRDVRLPETKYPEPVPPPSKASRPFAKIGDVVDVLPAGSAHQHVLAKQPLRIVAEPEEVEEEERTTRSKEIRAHKLSLIGSIFRSVRLSRAMTQTQVGMACGIANQRVSRIELGSTPSDDELLAFADCFKLDVGVLEKAREGTLMPDEAAAVMATPQPPPVVVSQPATSVDQFVAQSLRIEAPVLLASFKELRADVQQAGDRLAAEQTAALEALPVVQEMVTAAAVKPAWLDNYEDFLSHLMEVAPVPSERAKRSEWFKLARALHDLEKS